MGYFGKLEEKLLAQKLRRRGLSYGEILRETSVSKSTISEWCKEIPLTQKQKKRLLNKKYLGQRKGSMVAAENKRKKRKEHLLEIRKNAKKELGALSRRDRFVVGISLYAAEGGKSEGQGEFANSDPTIIKFMVKWFIEFLQMPKEKLRGAIWIHEGLNEKNAKIFWSELTEIPLNQFHKTYVVKSKINSKKIRKNIHQHGVFSIRFSDTERQRKIKGWIFALFNGRIKKKS